MSNPFLKQSAKMLFIAWNHPIEALAPNRADQPFARRVRDCGRMCSTSATVRRFEAHQVG